MPPSLMPRWVTRPLLGCLLLGMGYTSTSLTLAAARVYVVPPQVHIIVVVSLTAGFSLLLCRGWMLQLHERFDSLHERFDRLGSKVDDNTGEIERVRACPMLPPDNVQAFELGRQTEANVRSIR